MSVLKMNNGLGGLLSVVGMLLFCISAPAQAAPSALNDTALDRITAGHSEIQTTEGLIVGNSSEAIINRHADLVLRSAAQDLSMGLNLVNSSGSAVVNAVNIWDGKGLKSTDLKVAQVNRVEQFKPHSAKITGYLRSEMEQRVLNESLSHEDSTARVYSQQSVNDLVTSDLTSNTNSRSGVDTSLTLRVGDSGTDLPQFFFESNLGTGAAAAGHLDAYYDAGSAYFEVAANAAASINPSISIGNFFSGSVGLTAEAGLKIFADVDLPKLELHLNGGGCGVLLGSCFASGSQVETLVESIDKSKIDIIERNESINRQSLKISLTEHRSPFSIDTVEAEYIVVDDSSLIVEREESLELSDSAQSHTKGMNLVNALGSTVTNVTNISRSRQLNYRGELMLTQFNFVSHGN